MAPPGFNDSQQHGTKMDHLANLLKEIDQRDEKANMHHLEMDAAQTQKDLLTEDLTKAKCDLVKARDENTKLCQSIGSLNQRKMDLENECGELKNDLKSIKTTHEEFVQRVAALRKEKEDLKSLYIDSLSTRTEMVASAIAQASGAVASSSTAASPASEKGKDAAESELVGKDMMNKISIMCQKWKEERPLENNASDFSDGHSLKSSRSFEITNAETIEKLKGDLQKIRASNSSFSSKQTTLEKENEKLQDSLKKNAQKVKELEVQLKEARKKAEVVSTMPAPPPANESVELVHLNRVKELEDNLEQMNGYADMLELIINACGNCTTKLQQSQDVADPDASQA